MKQFMNNFHKYRYLLSQLVKKNIKLRYRRSYLGILWTLIEPLLTMIVLSIVFGALLGRNRTDPAFDGVPFPLYVLTGRLLYSFFSSSTNTAMKSIRNNSPGSGNDRKQHQRHNHCRKEKYYLRI